ncbi:MAG: FmdB family transcriptional regulator [Actinomycetota bacterium]|nr:FmdB family transcriptional regulator [Actinomycetota bacterium]
MPTYEYACKSCGEHLEVVQSFKDDPLTTCPRCGGQLRKVFGAIGIAFKGSGFYKTDSRAAASTEHTSGSGAERKADAKAEGAGGSSSDKKADSPASKPESSTSPSSKPDAKSASKSDPKAAASS